MRTGKDITEIFIHCSAGYGSIESIQDFWKSLGWNSPGYHLIIDLEGKTHPLQPFTKYSNGVKGHNTNAINISYIGGVEKTNTKKALDSRTPAQKKALLKAIKMAIKWVEDNGGSKSKLTIKGHRDVSPDKNKNGIIESWERIKECPSFDAIPEYKHLLK